ncbi:UDP-N-acetylmuramoyl-tripeptide--D-alanyl-D-alanine ligase [Mycoplasmatota bacterium WC44]
MIKRTLEEIRIMVNGEINNDTDEDTTIHGVSIDTRTLKEGQLYIPIIGEKFNGHDFIRDAIEQGAYAALWSESYIPDVNIPLIIVKDSVAAIQSLAKHYREQLTVKVIGITGTNGKTSTKDILGSILSTKYKTFKTKGNLNNHLGVPLTLLSLESDTEMAVVEMGMSDLGEIEVLTKIASPDVAVITNIGSGHLEVLKTKENVANAKLEIIKGLKLDGLFIYNGDDQLLEKKASKITNLHEIKTFGQRDNNDFQFRVISNTNGITFKINKLDSFFLPMLGVHQAYNATASIAVANHFNIPLDFIKKGLTNIQLTSMRNEIIKAVNFDILNDAYNCNPESTKAAINTIYSLTGYKQKIIVFADMLELGENEIELHKEIGRQINFNEVDYLFTYGELAKYTAYEAKKKSSKENVFSFNTKAELILLLQQILKKDGIILLKGSRGMKLEDIANALLKK